MEHLWHGVHAQCNEYSLDRDAQKGSPTTITREESRSVVTHALDAMKSNFAVCITGQPGIGKKGGCMMYDIQDLINQGGAGLYFGYK